MTATTAIGQAMESALDGTIGPYGLTIAFQVMPEMDAEDYAELKADIKANGIHTPVVYDQQDRVVDGHHRLQIADELGLDSDEIPWTQVHVSDPTAGRDMAYRVNTHRRHLTRKERREALERSLRADPELSDRQHAERLGVHNETAGAARKRLVEAGELTESVSRVSRDGRERPATQPPRSETSDAERTDSHDRQQPATNPAREPDPEPAAPKTPPAERQAPSAPAPRPVRGPTAQTEEQRQQEVCDTGRRIAAHLVSNWRSDAIAIDAAIQLGETGLVTERMIANLRECIELLERHL